MVSEHHVDDIRRTVVAHRPGCPVDSIVPIGSGLDHWAYEVNGELIVRFRREPDSARVEREARLLTVVADVSPLPVPVPAFTDAERSCLAYLKLPGVPLLDPPRPQWSVHGPSIAATLGGLLTALHGVPVERVADLVEPDEQPLDQWRREATELYETITERVPTPHHRPVEEFLNQPPPPDRHIPVFSHNDLGIEHVLVDPIGWTVTGVIDWSDAAIVDPAYDFGLLYRDLGPGAFRVAIDHYRTDAHDITALTRRAVFYARCSVFEDLAYGMETGQDRYADQSVAALEWLFPAAG